MTRCGRSNLAAQDTDTKETLIMLQVEVELEKVQWPNSCAYCNDAAETVVRANSRAIQKVGYWISFVTYTSRIIQFGFPVCRAHKTKARIASAVSQRRLISLGLGVMTAFALLGAAGDLYRLFTSPDPYELSWAKIGFIYAFPLLYWSTFYWAKNNAPILIRDLKSKIILQFRNDDFGRAFAAINEISIRD